MKFTAKEIARIVDGELQGNGEALVTGVAPISEAASHDITFLSDPKYLKELPSCRAAVILVKKGTPVSNSTAVFVDNPQFAFSKILGIVAKEKENQTREIHPTAVISASAQIGRDVSIGAYAVIESDAVIGEGSTIGPHCFVGRRSSMGKNCMLHPHVTIREEISIGDRVIIHSGTVVGSDGFGYVTVDGIHRKIPQIGTVEIEADVEIGANAAIDRATIGKTTIGQGSKIDNLVQIAHNVKVGRHCFIVGQAGIAGSTKLGNYVTLAGQSGLSGHITVGNGVIVAAQSGVPGDLPAGAVVFGSPARPIQEERKIQALLSRLPKIYDELKKIKKMLKISDK